MDFSNDNISKPEADLSADEGRSHFLETLGAGDDALNSLRQLRELTAQSRDGVVLSSQPDDITDSVSGSVQSSHPGEVQLPGGRVNPDLSDEPKVGPEAKNREVSIEVAIHQPKPAAEEVDFGVSARDSDDKEEVEALKVEVTGFSDLSEASDKDEEAVAESPESIEAAEEEVLDDLDAQFEEEAQFEMEALAEMQARFETEAQAERELAKEAGVESVDDGTPADEGVSAEEEEVSADAPTTLVPADPAPNEQITLSCPKCEGELTLMRQHLGVEGNCVWCQLPIVAAASGADGHVRIFPLQSDAVALESSAPEEAVAEEKEEVAAGLATVDEPETEAVAVEEEAPKAEEAAAPDQEVTLEEKVAEEVAIDEVASDEADPVELEVEVTDEGASEEVAEEKVDEEAIPDGFAEVTHGDVSIADMVPEEEEAPEEASSEKEFITESEKAESEEMPVTIDSFQSPAADPEPSFLAPTGDLPPLAPLPTGFQDSLPDSPVEEEPQDVVPSGFASAMPAPVSDFEVDLVSPFDSRDEQNFAPTEWDPNPTPSSGLAGLPEPVKEDVVVPSGFTSIAPAPAPATEVDDAPVEMDAAPAADEFASFPFPAADPDPVVENDEVPSGFNSPVPWGAPIAPANDKPVADEPVMDVPASEVVPSDFTAPAEVVSSGGVEKASEPWAVLPPMPESEVDASPMVPETNLESAQEPSGFVERKDETEAAAMSGFAPSTGLDDAPQPLPSFPPASDSEGISGFDVPSSVQEGNSFGSFEMSQDDSVSGLPAPQMDSKPDVELKPDVAFGSPAPSGFTDPEPEKDEAAEQGFGVSLMNPAEDSSSPSPFSNSPFATFSNDEATEVVEETPEVVAEETPEEKKLPPPLSEVVPVNKIPEPEGPRVESKPLGSISPKKKSRKGFIIFMVILVGFVCGGALATFVLPVDEYVAAARSYMEGKFSVEGEMPPVGIDLPAVINPEEAPVVPPAN